MIKNILKISGILFLIVFIFNSCFKDDLLKEIDALKTQVYDMKKRNDSLNNVLNVRADSLGKALSNAQKRSDSLANVLRTKSDSLSLALGITNANLANLTKSVDSIKSQMANISGQLTQLNLQLTSITTQLTQLNQQLGALGGDVSQLTAQYQALSASLQTINTQIAALQAEQLKLLEKLNAILLQLNPPIDLTTGLVAYYPFNGNAGDSSGNGNNGSVNGAILTNERFGNTNKAYGFTNSLNTICTSSRINSPQLFSYSFWFSSKAINSWILGFNDNDNLCNHIFKWDRYLSLDQNGKLNFRVFVGGVTPNVNIMSVKSYNDDIWHNVVVNYSNSKIQIYVDGIIEIEYINNTLPETYSGLWRIGGLGKNEVPTFIGKIDDVRIYNRVLTQREITYLANN